MTDHQTKLTKTSKPRKTSSTGPAQAHLPFGNPLTLQLRGIFHFDFLSVKMSKKIIQKNQKKSKLILNIISLSNFDILFNIFLHLKFLLFIFKFISKYLILFIESQDPHPWEAFREDAEAQNIQKGIEYHQMTEEGLEKY
jgi:hypothetical protein